MAIVTRCMSCVPSINWTSSFVLDFAALSLICSCLYAGAKITGARSSGEIKGRRFTIEKEFEPGRDWDVDCRAEEVCSLTVTYEGGFVCVRRSFMSRRFCVRALDINSFAPPKSSGPATCGDNEQWRGLFWLQMWHDFRHFLWVNGGWFSKVSRHARAFSYRYGSYKHTFSCQKPQRAAECAILGLVP